jgi:D-alanyl-D-alanine carboxypeptidase/D-alanyl-D-alanine-endopeptidase (penicillin-binding protein 4)
MSVTSADCTLSGVCFFARIAFAAVKQKLQQHAIPETAIGVYVHEIGEKSADHGNQCRFGNEPCIGNEIADNLRWIGIARTCLYLADQLYANGKIIDGVLHGDLIIKGYGDPKLDLENFWLLIHRLRQTGLHEIKGNLILDPTHYDIPFEDPGEFDGQPYRTYNVLPEALLVNYSTSTIHLFPQPDKNSVRVVIDPLPESLRMCRII